MQYYSFFPCVSMGEIHRRNMYSIGRAVAPADCGDQEAAQVQGAEEEAEQVAGKGRQGEGRRSAEEEAALQVSRPKLADLPTTTSDRNQLPFGSGSTTILTRLKTKTKRIIATTMTKDGTWMSIMR